MFCELFGYSKQAYYKHQCCKKTSDSKILKLKEATLALRRQMPRLGVRKLYYLLNLPGKINIGRDKLFSILREEGLLVGKRRRYTCYNQLKTLAQEIPQFNQEYISKTT